MGLAFDTYAAVKRLRRAGFTEGQAEALSETLQDGVAGGGLAAKADLAGLATEAELAGVKDELKTELAGVKDELRSELAGAKAELKTELADLRSGMETRFARLEVDLVWLKRLGALIAALLAVPLLRELLAALP
ncbi:MAG: hypothetical protein GDA36_14220 [Rhodobacteraceae bacterium]|nr:hypothetical protein [Paracoccaceae bacterium]